MRLPNHQAALIERAKVVDYLLNPAHPDGAGKAAFFLKWGFSADDWKTFADAVREMISRTEISATLQSSWGQKLTVEGPLNGPKGVTPVIRTVWIVDSLSSVPRLVTAYPRD